MAIPRCFELLTYFLTGVFSLTALIQLCFCVSIFIRAIMRNDRGRPSTLVILTLTAIYLFLYVKSINASFDRGAMWPPKPSSHWLLLEAMIYLQTMLCLAFIYSRSRKSTADGAGEILKGIILVSATLGLDAVRLQLPVMLKETMYLPDPDYPASQLSSSIWIAFILARLALQLEIIRVLVIVARENKASKKARYIFLTAIPATTGPILWAATKAIHHILTYNHIAPRSIYHALSIGDARMLFMVTLILYVAHIWAETDNAYVPTGILTAEAWTTTGIEKLEVRV